jgi:hypothetical protein
MFTYKKYNYPQANEAPRYKMGSPAYIQNIYIHQWSTTHGASRAPPPAPPSGGGGPPPPAPPSGGGAPPPTDPSCPGGSRPVIAAPATAARRTMACHGGGNPHALL